ncbi:hypothetical protein TDB9533_00786 [Thalassocella blandensis]|nr:hypothetical protein TDB9533_00786 [Thalassocella blandensis]
MDERDQKALDDIQNHGCHVLKVMEGDDQPCFTYTIGINKIQGKPDVIILGLKTELAHSILNHYKDRLLAGEHFKPGKFYSDFIENFDICFVTVAKKHFKEYFGWGLWLHDGYDFEMLQMVWPTTTGLWPWDDGKSDYYCWAQPILNESGAVDRV